MCYVKNIIFFMEKQSVNLPKLFNPSILCIKMIDSSNLMVCFNFSHWCEHRVEDKLEKIISPRLQLEVACSEVYQFNTQGWRLDVDRMRHTHGGDDGIALYYKRQGPNASCFLFK